MDGESAVEELQTIVPGEDHAVESTRAIPISLSLLFCLLFFPLISLLSLLPSPSFLPSSCIRARVKSSPQFSPVVFSLAFCCLFLWTQSVPASPPRHLLPSPLLLADFCVLVLVPFSRPPRVAGCDAPAHIPVLPPPASLLTKLPLFIL